MGHDLPRWAWPPLVEGIEATVRAGEAAAEEQAAASPGAR